MTVHWHHYKDASGPCNRLMGKDPSPTDSEPTHACREQKGSDCNVYTDEAARYNSFGKLVQVCFEQRADEIEKLK
jgi:hypothetical protein